MRLHASGDDVAIFFVPEEIGVLSQLVQQLVLLLESHSDTPLDPDPLFASLEIGGSSQAPEDPALARLFPDAFTDADDAASFRRVTEQGLINRKIQDAHRVLNDLTRGQPGAAQSLGVAPTTGATAGATNAADAGAASAATEPHEDAGSEFGEGLSVTISPDAFLAWARTVTALRLAMAARIGLERESDYDRLIDAEATRGTVLIYDWLAALLDAVLALGDVRTEE